MAQVKYDVLGVGNAIVDILARADDAFLQSQGMAKGGMALVDEQQAEALYGQMTNRLEASGGSAANSIAGIASFGGTAAFIGRVRNDDLGATFGRDLQSLGIAFETSAATSGPSTARCMILVTPDAQRTMNTCLGASAELGEDDISETLVAASQITYLEGYLFDPPPAKAAFRKAAKLAREAGRKVALTLSDSFCVERHRDAFLELIREHVDIVFANEAEIASLYPGSDLGQAASTLAGQVDIAAITRSEKGSLLVHGQERIDVPAVPVQQVVDTTGAGDLYAAGLLFGLTHGKPLGECGRLGSVAAAEIISHFGARPETSLAELAG